jgi:Family of unknown function (DUF6454)
MALAGGVVMAATLGVDDTRSIVATRVMLLTRTSTWTKVSATPVGFDTHHPQGMVKVGDTLFVSSVEVTTPTKRLAQPVDGLDRDAGAGVGHIFRMTLDGRRLADVTIGEGRIYHPGGLDYDGASLWVAVAEYRPNSRSIVYRLDPGTLKPIEVLRVADHLGAIVHDPEADELVGVSWGSRRFYRWALDAQGVVTHAQAPLESLRTLNPSHYIDYQDCKFAGARRMLCSGVAESRTASGAPFSMGGLDLVSLDAGRPLHQIPLLLWTPAGVSLARNPVFLEPTATGLRGYFLPEDGASTLYVYDVNAR